MAIHSFDAALREAQKRGPEFQLFGAVYQLPASIPVGAVLEAQRLAQADKESEANVILLFDRLFGAAHWREAPADWKSSPGYTDARGNYHPSALVQRWLDLGLDIDALVEMTRWAFEQYGIVSAGEEPYPTEAPPATKTPRGRGRA